MQSIYKCLKEWTCTVEALGQGLQTILIRNYRTNLTEYLLYPTVSYALKDDYLDSFQKKHQSFVETNALPEKKGDKVLIRYYATLEKLIERPVSRLPNESNYIWTREHVREYMSGKKAYIWVLRVYKLSEPYIADPTPGAIKYANLKEEVSLEGIEPVLSDGEFSKVVERL
jgi:restriction system protein